MIDQASNAKQESRLDSNSINSASRHLSLFQKISIILAWLLALMWIVAATNKLLDLSSFAQAITRFRLTPNAYHQYWVAWVAAYVPWLEISIALGLLWARFRFAAGILNILLLTVLTAILLSAWVRGLNIECGCFGNRFDLGHVGLSVLRNVILLTISSLVVFGNWQRKSEW